jgi:antibiotic biosynthesis monooxygenase (ABM) superfamily enzyme
LTKSWFKNYDRFRIKNLNGDNLKGEPVMANARVLNIVATECPLKNDAKFNKWYDEVHIPMLFKYRGMKKVTRYRMMEDNKDKARYLAIYEFDNIEALEAYLKSPEYAAAIKEMQTTWKGQMFDIKWATKYQPIKTWER